MHARVAGSDKNISDPYLVCALLNDKGEIMDETRTTHIKDTRHPRWKETLRLFAPSNDLGGSATCPANVRFTVYDYNKKKEDTFIAEATVPLKVGASYQKVELISRCVSPLRPILHFKYEATPQMFFEEVSRYAPTAATPYSSHATPLPVCVSPPPRETREHVLGARTRAVHPPKAPAAGHPYDFRCGVRTGRVGPYDERSLRFARTDGSGARTGLGRDAASAARVYKVETMLPCQARLESLTASRSRFPLLNGVQ